MRKTMVYVQKIPLRNKEPFVLPLNALALAIVSNNHALKKFLIRLTNVDVSVKTLWFGEMQAAFCF